MSDESVRLLQAVYGRVNRAGELVLPKGERAALDGFVGSLLPGTKLIITVENQLPQRSIDQTKYYFGAMVRPMCEISGHTSKEQHELLVRELLPPAKLRPWDTTSLPNDFDGMAEFMLACIIFAAEHYEIVIEAPRRQPG